jgi:hypothetical protein
VQGSLERLSSTDLGGLDQVGLQQFLVQVQEAIGHLTGLRNRALGELDARTDGMVVTNPGKEGPPVLRPVHQWWRDAATLTGQQAGGQVRHAKVLRDLPLISDAVVDRALLPEQARGLARLHGRIPLEDLRASQADLIKVARPLNTDALNRWVAHVIATHCEPALERDQDRARERRYLQLRHDADGTVHGRFLLASEDAEAVVSVLEPLARPDEGDDRSSGQRRADALVDVFTAAARFMDLPHAGGQRANVSYVIPAGWAAGHQPPPLPVQLSAAGGHELASSQHACTGAWTGPQTRARVEAVLCDARISRVLLDPSGQVLSLESVKDQITPAQRRAVSARDRHCLARGCTRPPAFCDVHHLTSRADGGPTTVENLGLLCRRHHVLWHLGRIGVHHLHVPWLPYPEPSQSDYDPWDRHSPPLVA